MCLETAARQMSWGDASDSRENESSRASWWSGMLSPFQVNLSAGNQQPVTSGTNKRSVKEHSVVDVKSYVLSPDEHRARYEICPFDAKSIQTQRPVFAPDLSQKPSSMEAFAAELACDRFDTLLPSHINNNEQKLELDELQLDLKRVQGQEEAAPFQDHSKVQEAKEYLASLKRFLRDSTLIHENNYDWRHSEEARSEEIESYASLFLRDIISASKSDREVINGLHHANLTLQTSQVGTVYFRHPSLRQKLIATALRFADISSLAFSFSKLTLRCPRQAIFQHIEEYDRAHKMLCPLIERRRAEAAWLDSEEWLHEGIVLLTTTLLLTTTAILLLTATTTATGLDSEAPPRCRSYY